MLPGEHHREGWKTGSGKSPNHGAILLGLTNLPVIFSGSSRIASLTAAGQSP
jgi:hypothetical protein